MFIKDRMKRLSCENILGHKNVILYLSRKFAKLNMDYEISELSQKPPETSKPELLSREAGQYLPLAIGINKREGEQEKKAPYESNEHRYLRMENPELATKDHSYRKDKLSFRSDLDLFYKSHSENSHKKDKEHLKVFGKDNSEHHDYLKKDRLDIDQSKPSKASSTNKAYEPYEKVGNKVQRISSFGKDRFTPKEKSGKFLRRNDSEHFQNNRFHVVYYASKPSSIERLTSNLLLYCIRL